MALSQIGHLSLAGQIVPSCFDQLSQGEADMVPRREYILSNHISRRSLASQAGASDAFDQAAVELTPERVISRARHFVGVANRTRSYHRLSYESTVVLPMSDQRLR